MSDPFQTAPIRLALFSTRARFPLADWYVITVPVWFKAQPDASQGVWLMMKHRKTYLLNFKADKIDRHYYTALLRICMIYNFVTCIGTGEGEIVTGKKIKKGNDTGLNKK